MDEVILTKRDYEALLEYTQGFPEEHEYVDKLRERQSVSLEKLRQKIITKQYNDVPEIPLLGKASEENQKVKEFYEAEHKRLEERSKILKEVRNLLPQL